MSESKHTPEKLSFWKHGTKDDPSCILKTDSMIIFQTLGSKDEANAECLIKCWNSHDALLEGCYLGLSIARWVATIKNGPSGAKQDVKALEEIIAKAEKGA